MRKLTWVAVGYAAAAFLAEYFLPVQGLPYFAAALALFLPLCLLIKGKDRWKAMLCLGGAILGMLAWWHCYERRVVPCESLAGETVTVTARLTDYPQQWEAYTELDVRILDGAPMEKAVLFAYSSVPELRPGDVIEAEVRVSSVITVRGLRAHTYTANGVFLRAHVQGDVVMLQETTRPWLYLPKTISQTVKGLCDALFAPDTAPFMKALLTGDTASLRMDTETYSNMRVAGVLHVAAVSGMHLVVLMAMVELLLGRSRRTSLICIPVMAVFVFMAGCRASIVRAGVMQLVFLLAPLLEREQDGPSSLSAALLAILAVNPMAIGGAGLQLSFACILGFVVFLSQLRRWAAMHLPMRYWPVRFLAANVSASLCAMIFSAPIAAFYFGTIPLFSVFANLLTLSVVELCFGAGYGLCILAGLWPAAAGALAWGMDWVVRWCLLVYDAIAAIPFSCLYTVRAGAVWWLVAVYAVWGGWYLLRRRNCRIWATTPVCLCVLGLCVLLITGGVDFRSGGELTVLDVGQGQSVLLMDDSATVLIDCGGTGPDDAGDVAANYLLSAGKDRVDVLILTHLHEDHANGVEQLLTRVPVELMILPTGADDGDEMLRRLESAAAAQGTEILSLGEPCTVRTGGFSLALLLPQAGTEENERGIVVRAESDGTTAYIMGDAGVDAELSLLAAGYGDDADILVVGHHGSKTASGAMFLRALRAETAVVSAGYNSYGLPAEETLLRLEEYCGRVLRTDEDGTVTIEMKTDDVTYG